jgi:NTE family protein
MDALMASTANPPLFPPWNYRGLHLLDGGVAANSPLGIATQKGATEIYALEIEGEWTTGDGHWDIFEISARSVDALIDQQLRWDRALWAMHSEVHLRPFQLYAGRRVRFDDFGQMEALISDGREAARAYLAGEKDLQPRQRI